MSAPRLLIVDDDPALLQALNKALMIRMPLVIVEKCDSADAALQLLGETDYDAVISDIKMPGTDGLGLLARIREGYPELPTLLITGHGQHDLAVQALRGGAFDFIQKPVDRDYLVASLNRAFHVRHLAREVQRQREQLQQHAADLEQTVAQRTCELREANEAKDRFLATLAHELRNPLSTIRTATELMAIAGDDNSHREYAERAIATQVRHMVRLLDDLLDISRITQDRIVLQRELVDFADVVADAVDSARPAVDAQRHRLSLSLPDNPLPLNGDITRLQQIVTNLLTNAVKYTEPGGQIDVAVQEHDGQAILRICDSGIGIAGDMLPRVFEPFMQVEDSLARSQGGLGIGLTLVRKLVELHQGSVMAASDGPGHGTTITVRLPLSGEIVAARPDVEVPLDAPALRILLVEDNRSVARMTAQLLVACGHEVVQIAHDGPAALEAAVNRDIDAVLLDVGLPGLDGYEVAQRLRQQPHLERVLIVALTGYGQQEDRRRSREAGCDHHLVKPVSAQTLQRIFSEYRQTLEARLS